jgi:hypothetical protein
MRIEHWRCQAHHQDEQLNYRNLPGASVVKGSRVTYSTAISGRETALWNGIPLSLCITSKPAFDMSWMARSTRMTPCSMDN